MTTRVTIDMVLVYSIAPNRQEECPLTFIKRVIGNSKSDWVEPTLWVLDLEDVKYRFDIHNGGYALYADITEHDALILRMLYPDFDFRFEN